MIELAPALTTLDSRSTRLDRIFLRIAKICATLPMSIALAALTLYYLFTWKLMIRVSLFMTLIGIFAVIIGLCFTLVWCIRQRIAAKRLGEPARLRVGYLLTFLLLANFIVAFFCAHVGCKLADDGPNAPPKPTSNLTSNSNTNSSHIHLAEILQT
ncbi:MAG: hypothetical protein FWD53_02850 [Phycisphaerales bacterium]|nr:hypothetical protein [Phycisphaerales bacterium]